MHIYLNETCKNAISLQEFIKGISVELNDLIQARKTNLLSSTKEVFLKNYKQKQNILFLFKFSSLLLTGTRFAILRTINNSPGAVFIICAGSTLESQQEITKNFGDCPSLYNF